MTDIPMPPGSSWGPPVFSSRRTPENEYQALMEAAPGEEPAESLASLTMLRDFVASQVDLLEPRERWVIDAYMSERKSLSEIAKELGVSKTHVWRIRNEALAKLEGAIIMNDIIRRRVVVADTWEESANQWVAYIQANADKTKRDNFDEDEFMERLVELRDWLADCVRADDPPATNVFMRMATLCAIELVNAGLWNADELAFLLARKQHDYGHGNINAFGLFGIVVRLSDKVERYVNLTNKGADAQNESLLDTLEDIIGYCVIAAMFLDGTFQLQLGETYV